MSTELFNKGLPKWPALVVKGKPVTQDQAKEILVRTSSFYFSCNDREWEKIINKIIYGIDEDCSDLGKKLAKKHGVDEKDWNRISQIKDEYQEAFKPLSGLNFLTNHRISSSWIGGPHGWCSWNGKIGCSNYNIGKWPNVEDVYGEWEIIAKEFPFLNLKCQLMNSEAGEDSNPIPVVEFEIKKGKVKIYEPGEILEYPVFGSDDMIARFTNPYAERGCSKETLADALEFVKKKIIVDENIQKGEIWIDPSSIEKKRKSKSKTETK